MRGGSPVLQSQVDDAVHAAQMPSVHRSTPVPHAEVQLRSEVRPTLALLSSQSMPAAMPSWSLSTVVDWHAPPTQICPVGQAGSHTAASTGWIAPSTGAASRPPSPFRGFTACPLAHPCAKNGKARSESRAARYIEATGD